MGEATFHAEMAAFDERERSLDIVDYTNCAVYSKENVNIVLFKGAVQHFVLFFFSLSCRKLDVKINITLVCFPIC